MLGTDVIVRREPVGVVAAIVPWNVPQFVTMSKLAPALLAGCTDRHQAGAGDAARRLPDGRAARRGRHPEGRRVSIVPAGREVGEHLVAPPRRRQGRLHRLDRGRPHASPRSAASSSSGSASSSAASRPRSSSTTPTSPTTMEGLQVRVADEQRPGLRRADPDPRLPQALRRGRRRARPRWSAACRSATRPTRPPRSARWSRSASRSGSRSTSPSARRRAPASSSAATGVPDGLDQRLVRAADGVRRRRQRDAHRPGGDLRPGARR